MPPANLPSPTPGQITAFPQTIANATPVSSPSELLPIPTTPTPIESACTVGGTPEHLSLTSFQQAPQAIQDYLNSGAAPAELDTALHNAGYDDPNSPTFAADLNGDGRLDVVVAVVNSAANTAFAEGSLLIYMCEGSSYALAAKMDSRQTWGIPEVLFLEDLDGDGRIDLVTGQTTCGASTCFIQVQILSWNGSSFQNRLRGDTSDLPYPDFHLQEEGSTGVFDLYATSGGFGSVGAGLQRGMTRIWSYQPASKDWTLKETILAPSEYRIHFVQDADAVLQSGDVQKALGLFQRVASDQPPLQDWIDSAREKQDLEAYANYKQIALYTMLGDDERAVALLADMQAAIPTSTPQYAYVQMAALYRQTEQKSGEPAACRAVMDFAAQHSEQILLPLGSSVFGYANRDYQPKDMCLPTAQ